MANDPPIQIAGNVIGVPFLIRTDAGLTLFSATQANVVAVGNATSSLGFFGKTPATQPAAPTDAATIIAALQTLGLVAGP